MDVLPFLDSELEIKVAEEFLEAALDVIKDVDIDNLEYNLIVDSNIGDNGYVKKDENTYLKAIFILIVVFSLIVSYKYLKLF